MSRILIDAGHGGHDSGAVSLDGKTLEKDIALKVAKMVADNLEASGKVSMVHLSRSDDTFLTLSERARKANFLSADMLSIHCNAGGGNGFEVFTSPGLTRSDKWATATLERMEEAHPDRRLRADWSDGDPDKEARFTVLTKTKGPAILVELGFIDTEAGQSFLENPENQVKMANAISQAYLDVS